MKDKRTEEYHVTENRTVAQLSREELEIAYCNLVDAVEHIQGEFTAKLDRLLAYETDETLRYKDPLERMAENARELGLEY